MKPATSQRLPLFPSERVFALWQAMAWCMAVVYLLTGATGLAQEHKPAELPAPSLSHKLELALTGAAGGLRPVTQEQVLASVLAAQKRLAELQAFLKQDPKQGPMWTEFLLLTPCGEQLRAVSPQIFPLEKTVERLESGFGGLELPAYQNLRAALAALLPQLRLIYDPAAADNYTAMLRQVRESYQAYLETGDAEARRNFSAAVLWLEERGQAPQVTSLILGHFNQPNLFVQLNAQMVARGMEEEINRDRPIRDFLLGTSVHGIGHVEGQVTVRFLPNDKHGSIEAITSGIVCSNTVGYNGPVRIYSRGATPFRAWTQLIADERGLTAAPSYVTAQTSARATGVATNKRLFAGLIRRFAWKKIRKQQGQANAVASQHARRDLKKELDIEFAQKMKDANANFHRRLLFPLRRSGAFPSRTMFSTTRQWLNIRGIEARGGQLATELQAPSLNPGAWMAFRLHESMVENLFGRALAGETLTDEQMRKEATQILGKVPEQLMPKENAKPWSITFAAQQPVSVAFKDQGMKIVLQGARYTSADTVLGAMNILADYTFTREGSTVIGTRTQLEALPPGFDPEKERLGARAASARRQLRERFEEIFPAEIKIEKFRMQGEMKEVGDLVPKQFASERAWFTISFVPPAK